MSASSQRPEEAWDPLELELQERHSILYPPASLQPSTLPFLTWPLPLQLENIGNFIKAITKYGVKPHDIFEANDLFENTNHTQVQSTLLALASMVSVRAEWAWERGSGQVSTGTLRSLSLTKSATGVGECLRGKEPC